MRGATQVPTARIFPSDTGRAINEDRVAAIADSIDTLGLRTPLTVRPIKRVMGGKEVDAYEIVCGQHRYWAVQRLAWDHVQCFVTDEDETTCRLWEIDENLCRQELSPAEYSAHVARRKELYEALYPETKAAVAGGKARQGAASDNLAFAQETAAKTGKSERTVQRAAERGENVADDVRQRIQGTKLDKGTYLDALAKLEPEQQREKVDADLAQPPAAKRGTSTGQDEAEKADQRHRKKQAADQIANLLAEHIPLNHWAALKANLRMVSGKDVADAFERETGVAVFDNSEAA